MSETDLVERVKDGSLPAKERGDALIVLGREGRKEDLLGIIGELKANQDNLNSALVEAFPEPYIRSALAIALGMFQEREVYEPLMSLVQDPEEYVRCDAISGMGETKDSRISFALMNLYPGAGYEEQKRILLALKTLADPRTIEFLSRVSGDDALTELGDRAWAASSNNVDFTYTFHGGEERRKKEEEVTGQIVLSSYGDIPEEVFRDDLCRQPQTYIVTTDGKFVIGGLLDEHVKVAKGQDVRAAGEALFEKQEGKWVISSINNRSNGYYPAASSYHWVREALSQAGIQFPQGFLDSEGGSNVFPNKKDYTYCDKEFLQHQPLFKDA